MHLAQINIGRSLAPLDTPQLADFMANLDPINAIAEASPGFVWRLKTDAGNATDIKPFADDELLIVNMSVWESPDALRAFVFQPGHLDFVKRRKEWFEKFPTAYMALWWIPEGHTPTIDEAKERLASLDQHGDTEFAFTFRKLFPMPGTGV
jgi:hypothetical protein